MAESPAAGADGTVRIAIFSNGEQLGEDVRLVAVSIERAVNRLPSARLVFLDGDMAESAWPLSDQSGLLPGAVITITAGYGAEMQPLFEGVVVKQALRIGSDGDGQLIVDCCDRAVLMSVQRRSASFPDQRDSDLVRGLIERAGLKAAVQTTAATHINLVQYGRSDWDFIVSRAEANGMQVIATDGSVTVAAPDFSSTPLLQVIWGRDLIAFDAEIDARSQFASTETFAWDPQLQIQGEARALPRTLNAQGDLDASTLAQALGLGSCTLQAGVPMPAQALQAWADARQQQAGLARIHGHMRFQGSAAARVGGLIEVLGVGRRFSGNVFVSGLRHEIADGNWLTEAEFGLPPDQPDASAGETGLAGLHVGKIVALEGDPEDEHRVQVRIPALGRDAPAVWARLLQAHASDGFGAFFAPEVDDEVVLGFFASNPTHPVVMGSLYSSARVPPYRLENGNDTKAIVTRAKLRVEFDEQNAVITVTTPANNRIVLSDRDKSITLLDQHDNRVELNPQGVTIDASKDLQLRARGSISLDAGGALRIASRSDATVTGLNVHCEAQVGFAAKGGASAELSAAGQTVVRGAVVMIN